MTRYLDPRNDLVFKKIFGEHPDLLLDFLNAVLPLPADGQIAALSYLPAEQVPVLPPDNRRGILDVKCTDCQGRVFIVEMQIYWIPSFFKRVLFNTSQASVVPLAPGDDYKYPQPVYALGIVNDVFADGSDWYHHYQIINNANTRRVIDGLQFVFIELPKFKPETGTERQVRALWLRFLKETRGEMQPPAELLDYPPTQAALSISKEAGFTCAELAAYQAVMMAISNEKSLATDFIEKGRQEGRAEGRQDEKLAIARKLLAMMDDAEIAQITGLAMADVRRLRSAGQ